MSQVCTRCGGTGFLNIEQLPAGLLAVANQDDYYATIRNWADSHKQHDVAICDCCGDGDDWYGVPGEHYNRDDPAGPHGPYASNGGLCQCH